MHLQEASNSTAIAMASLQVVFMGRDIWGQPKLAKEKWGNPPWFTTKGSVDSKETGREGNTMQSNPTRSGPFSQVEPQSQLLRRRYGVTDTLSAPLLPTTQ